MNRELGKDAISTLANMSKVSLAKPVKLRCVLEKQFDNYLKSNQDEGVDPVINFMREKWDLNAFIIKKGKINKLLDFN